MRVSDAEREQAVVSLRDHLLAGRLTLDEFSERVEAALRARVGGDLSRVREDLPEIPAEAARSRRKPARFTAALFGHVARRGRIRLRGWTVAASSLGDLDFDLREATIDHPQTAVTVLVAFGNADVYVPEGVNVDVSGITIFGHRREWGRDIGRPDAPAVHVRVLGCFGTVTYGECRTICTAATATSSASWKSASVSFPRETARIGAGPPLAGAERC